MMTFSLILITLLSISAFLYTGYNMHDFFMTISYVIGYAYMVFIICQYICASYACRERLLTVKRKLSFRSQLNSQEVREYVELSMALFQILRKINKYLTFPLIIIFLCLLLDFTFEFYGVAREFFVSSFNTFIIGYNGSFWCLLEIYPIIMTIYFSESTWKAVEGIKDVGCSILCDQRIFDFKTERSFNYFIKSIKKQKLQGSTIFFQLDWKLLFQVK